MKSRTSIIAIFGILVTSCSSPEPTNSVDKKESSPIVESADLFQNREEVFFHYSIWWAFVNKVFDGDLSVAKLKSKGTIGLGSYTQLDGELIMLDGIPYRVREDGVVSIPENDDKIVYANAAFFNPEYNFKIGGSIGYDTLRERINKNLPTENQFYAFRIKGDFKYMKCGGLHKQEKPYEEGLDVLIPNRPIFERENFSGTMVGFYCPEFIGNINVAGYHMHFISEDKKFGGHVMEFESKNLEVEIDPLLEYQFVLPNSQDFFNVALDKEFQYKKK